MSDLTELDHRVYQEAESKWHGELESRFESISVTTIYQGWLAAKLRNPSQFTFVRDYIRKNPGARYEDVHFIVDALENAMARIGGPDGPLDPSDDQVPMHIAPAGPKSFVFPPHHRQAHGSSYHETRPAALGVPVDYISPPLPQMASSAYASTPGQSLSQPINYGNRPGYDSLEIIQHIQDHNRAQDTRLPRQYSLRNQDTRLPRQYSLRNQGSPNQYNAPTQCLVSSQDHASMNATEQLASVARPPFGSHVQHAIDGNHSRRSTFNTPASADTCAPSLPQPTAPITPVNGMPVAVSGQQLSGRPIEPVLASANAAQQAFIEVGSAPGGLNLTSGASRHDRHAPTPPPGVQFPIQDIGEPTYVAFESPSSGPHTASSPARGLASRIPGREESHLDSDTDYPTALTVANETTQNAHGASTNEPHSGPVGSPRGVINELNTASVRSLHKCTPAQQASVSLPPIGSVIAMDLDSRSASAPSAPPSASEMLRRQASSSAAIRGLRTMLPDTPYFSSIMRAPVRGPVKWDGKNPLKIKTERLGSGSDSDEQESLSSVPGREPRTASSRSPPPPRGRAPIRGAPPTRRGYDSSSKNIRRAAISNAARAPATPAVTRRRTMPFPRPAGADSLDTVAPVPRMGLQLYTPDQASITLTPATTATHSALSSATNNKHKRSDEPPKRLTTESPPTPHNGAHGYEVRYTRAKKRQRKNTTSPSGSQTQRNPFWQGSNGAPSHWNRRDGGSEMQASSSRGGNKSEHTHGDVGDRGTGYYHGGRDGDSSRGRHDNRGGHGGRGGNDPPPNAPTGPSGHGGLGSVHNAHLPGGRGRGGGSFRRRGGSPDHKS